MWEKGECNYGHPLSPCHPHPCPGLLACDVRPVIYEKVGRDHSLVSGQHNLLQKFRAKVLLHPSVLEVTEEMTSDRSGNGSA